MLDRTVKLISANPTLRVDGQKYDRLDEQLVEMRLHEQLGGLSSLEVRLNDSVSGNGSEQYAFADESVFKLGAELRLGTGEVDDAKEIFRGRVSAMEAELSMAEPPVFTVLAEDALQKARRSRRSVTYVNKTPAEIIRDIANWLGLKVDIRDGLDVPKFAHLYQHNESDLAFLRRLLERFDADMQMVGDTLQVGPIAREHRGTIDLVYGKNLIRLRATADLADVAESVRVAGWDPQQGSAADATASDGTLGPGSGRSGTSFLARALDAGQLEHLGTQGQMTQQEADAVARALYGRRARRFVRAWGTAQGDPRLRVGTWVKLAGINPLLATSCTVAEATHRFDKTSGYTTDFVAEGAYMGQPS